MLICVGYIHVNLDTCGGQRQKYLLELKLHAVRRQLGSSPALKICSFARD